MFAYLTDGWTLALLRISVSLPLRGGALRTSAGPPATQRAARRAGSYCLTAAFSWLPAENFGTLLAGMVTF
jgi:hypothetical protein